MNEEFIDILLRCIYGARSSHPLFSGLSKIMKMALRRYEYCITTHGIKVAIELLRRGNGRVHRARQYFDEWEEQEKIDLLLQVNSLKKIFL